jgi:hypothetical protein
VKPAQFTKPKLAAFTHLVFLASERVPPASVDDLIAETRQTYAGPLEIGEDLMSFEKMHVQNWHVTSISGSPGMAAIEGIVLQNDFAHLSAQD